MRPYLTALILTLSSSAGALAEDQPAPPQAGSPTVAAPAVIASTTPAAPEETATHTLRPGPLTVTIEADGHLEAAQVRRLKLSTELWNGPFILSEILPSDQPVEAGAVIARFDSPKVAKWVRSGQEALETAKFRVAVLADELAALRRGQALRLERDTQDLEKSTKEWEHYLAFVVEQRTRRANNDLQRAENALLVAETEFTQLDKMYRESRISDDTKDIVLDRTRKSLATQREATELARREHKTLFAHELPSEKLDWQRSIERKRQDLETLRAAQVLAERQKVEELSKAERGLRDTQEMVDGYLADQQRLTVTAPFAGILRHSGLEVGDSLGDTAGKNAAFAELHREAPFHLRLALPPQDAAQLKTGDRLRVQIPDLARGELEGEVLTIGNLATRDAQGVARFAVTLRLAIDPRLRIGLRAKIRHSVTLAETLAVPRSFVTTSKGESTCEVRTAAGSSERRTVVLGLGNVDQVQILSGLLADEVVLRSPGKKGGP
jgi:multidrug resistance efflux pump